MYSSVLWPWASTYICCLCISIDILLLRTLSRPRAVELRRGEGEAKRLINKAMVYILQHGTGRNFNRTTRILSILCVFGQLSEHAQLVGTVSI
ncbi:hypothetical protein BJ138DRAFT_44414 [Hygrophoropsis aurantiaca]|uniref:Uncharacterized protein n=1 Tax=Hygrophoropsis aurantiaca TaxID=72124 RepID=A0ACB8ACK3_9AGAM|nr:hypothetical protein BJ138DRAFT_44414 [Hygrophoropsis aurantiaca]